MLATILAMLLAAAAPAAPLDPPHAAVLAVLSRDEAGSGCTPAGLRSAAASASIRTLGRVEGDGVVLATVQSPCLCGAQNCPYYALRLTAGTPRVLLSSFGIELRTRAAVPLPTIVVRSHDSAAIDFESTFAYRNGRYDQVDGARLRWIGAGRKPVAPVPVRFAAGTSSAPLRGSIALGWYDEWAFAANKGQQLAIHGVSSRAPLRLTLMDHAGGTVAELHAGAPFTLPASGTYRLHVESDAEHDAPYALRLTIRP